MSINYNIMLGMFFYHCSLQSNSKGKLSKPLIRGQWVGIQGEWVGIRGDWVGIRGEWNFFLSDFPNISM